jgi:hypothetical protein
MNVSRVSSPSDYSLRSLDSPFYFCGLGCGFPAE